MLEIIVSHLMAFQNKPLYQKFEYNLRHGKTSS